MVNRKDFKILGILVVFLCSICIVSASNYLNDHVRDQKLSLSKYVTSTLIQNYNSSREYAACIDSRYYDHTYHGSYFDSGYSGYLPENVSYSRGFFYGTVDYIWSWCRTDIHVHSHSEGYLCQASPKDLDGWKGFKSVDIFIIQCSSHDLKIYLKKDLQRGIVQGYDYKI